jgi:hypothetical protein
MVINRETGQPAIDAEVIIVPRALTHDAVVATMHTDSNGAFDISGIASGSYIVSTSFGEMREFTGYVPIEVAGADLNGITLNASRGYDVPGRLVIDTGLSNITQPASRLVPGLLRNPFMGLPPAQPLGTPGPNVAEDGSFVIKSVATGDYRVFVRDRFGSTLPDAFYLKSVRFGASDVLADGVHIDGQTGEELEVVLGTDVATVSGTVVNQRQEPIPNAVVAVIPYPIGSERRDLDKNGATDVSGKFQVHGIAPGDYMVFAWDNAEFGAWLNPEFLRTYESVGKRVHLTGAANESVDLTIYQ